MGLRWGVGERVWVEGQPDPHPPAGRLPKVPELLKWTHRVRPPTSNVHAGAPSATGRQRGQRRQGRASLVEATPSDQGFAFDQQAIQRVSVLPAQTKPRPLSEKLLSRLADSFELSSMDDDDDLDGGLPNIFYCFAFLAHF